MRPLQYFQVYWSSWNLWYSFFLRTTSLQVNGGPLYYSVLLVFSYSSLFTPLGCSHRIRILSALRSVVKILSALRSVVYEQFSFHSQTWLIDTWKLIAVIFISNRCHFCHFYLWSVYLLMFIWCSSCHQPRGSGLVFGCLLVSS